MDLFKRVLALQVDLSWILRTHVTVEGDNQST